MYFYSYFNYLLEKFPLLNIKRLVKDINFILYSYQIGCKVVEKKGEIEIVNLRNIDILLDQDKEIRKSFNKLSKKVDDLTIDILFNTKQKYLDKHLELAILIALENQLNNDAIVLSNGFLQGVYGEDLDLCLLMLVEFINNDQQVILSYDSPYDYTLIEQVKNTINYFNKGFGENIYNPIEFNERYTTEEEWNNKSITIAARELVARSEMNYETKIKLSKKIIIDALSKVNDYSKMALGFSYGKDSLCLLIILKNVIDDINKNSNFKIPYPKLVFCNSGVEFPETYAYKLKFDKILKGWGFEIYTTKPKERFWDIIEKEGFPMFGKAIRKNKNPEIFEKIEKLGIKTCGNQCCLKLKEIPSSELYKKLGIEMVFVGILAEESYTRKTRWYELGDTYWNKTEGLFKCQPLIHFSEDDVWKTIKDSGVPYNPTYDMGYWKTDKNGEEVFVKYGRTGCWPCSMNIQFSGNNIEMLRNTHPKLWDLIMNKKGLGKEIFKFKHYISEEQWSEREIHMLEAYLERKPCHFDTTDWKGIV